LAKEDTGALVQALPTIHEEFLNRDAIKPLAWKDCVDFSLVLYEWAHDMRKVIIWASRAADQAFGSEQAQASIDEAKLFKTAELLSWTFLPKEGKTIPGFGPSLVGLAKADKLRELSNEWLIAAAKAKSCARLLAGAEDRQALRDLVVAPDGSPRGAVAKILSCAYRDAKDQEEWKAYLDDKAGAPGDAGLKWAMERGFAEAVRRNQCRPLLGKQWLDKVVESAESESLRFAAVTALAYGYMFDDHYDEGLAYLDSVGQKFTEDKNLKGLVAIRDRTISEKFKYLRTNIANYGKQAANLESEMAGETDPIHRSVQERWSKEFRARQAALQELLDKANGSSEGGVSQ
jgi:hypothetical protein